MPAFGAINACVNVDGVSLPEYGVQINEAEKEVTCWIPSEVGKNFSVLWCTERLYIDTVGLLVLDGKDVGGLVALKHSTKEKQEFASEYITATTCRDFSFAPIKYTDDDKYLGSSTRDVGNIQLTVWRIEVGEILPYFGRPDDAPDATLHERSKKLGAHCVQFSDIRTAAYKISCKTKRIEVVARFVFRYRPIDMLRAIGVAPLPPQKEPVKIDSKRKYAEVIEIKDDPDEDIEERVTRLKKELKDLESRHVKKRKVKVDRPVTLVDNEVIDLT